MLYLTYLGKGEGHNVYPIYVGDSLSKNQKPEAMSLNFIKRQVLLLTEYAGVSQNDSQCDDEQLDPLEDGE